MYVCLQLSAYFCGAQLVWKVCILNITISDPQNCFKKLMSVVTFVCIFTWMHRHPLRYLSSPLTRTHHRYHGNRHQGPISQFLGNQVHSLVPGKLCSVPKERKGLFGKALVQILMQCQLRSFLCFICSWVFRPFLFLSLRLNCLRSLMCLWLCYQGSGSDGF